MIDKFAVVSYQSKSETQYRDKLCHQIYVLIAEVHSNRPYQPDMTQPTRVQITEYKS